MEPLLNCRHDFFVRPEMTSTYFGKRKNSLGARSGEQAGCGINAYPFRSKASSIATLQVWTLALSCSSTPLESLPRRFSRMAFLSWSSKFAQYAQVIVLVLGKMSNKITLFVSQNTVAITLPTQNLTCELDGAENHTHQLTRHVCPYQFTL